MTPLTALLLSAFDDIDYTSTETFPEQATDLQVLLTKLALKARKVQSPMIHNKDAGTIVPASIFLTF